jgi:hypothetical protein
MNLFGPGSRVTFLQAREIWKTLTRRFSEAMSGKITIPAGRIVPNSVVEGVGIPALRANPNVTLEIR